MQVFKFKISNELLDLKICNNKYILARSKKGVETAALE